MVALKIFLKQLRPVLYAVCDAHGALPLLSGSHPLGLKRCNAFSPGGNMARPCAWGLLTRLAWDCPSAGGMCRNTRGALGYAIIVTIIVAQQRHGAIQGTPCRAA